jgi:hypothetical protein
VLYYDRADYTIAYSHFGLDPESWGYDGNANLGRYFTLSATRPRGSTTFSTFFIYDILVHELVHVIQAYIADWEYMDQNGLNFVTWLQEGTAVYFERGLILRDHSSYVIERVRNNNIPTLDILDQNHNKWTDFAWEANYVWGATVVMFIADTWGFDKVVEMNRRHGDYQGIFGISRTEFERRWHAWLRTNYR